MTIKVLSQISVTSTAVRSVHLVETSAPLRKQQAAILEPHLKRLGCSLQFHDTIDELEPDNEVFTALLAHEFFDALPFRVIQVGTSIYTSPNIGSLTYARSVQRKVGQKFSLTTFCHPTPLLPPRLPLWM